MYAKSIDSLSLSSANFVVISGATAVNTADENVLNFVESCCAIFKDALYAMPQNPLTITLVNGPENIEPNPPNKEKLANENNSFIFVLLYQYLKWILHSGKYINAIEKEKKKKKKKKLVESIECHKIRLPLTM
mgnify:CR=1 FL=1